MVDKKKTKNNTIIEEAKEILEEAGEITEDSVKETSVEEKEKEYIDRLQRLQAEFENFRRRTEKEKRELQINANENLISQLLEVVDNFELSLKHNEDKGVALIYSELTTILEKQGLKPINANGKFNPELHEALMQEEGEEDGIILQVFQKGYLLNDKLLRASKVKISKASGK